MISIIPEFEGSTPEDLQRVRCYLINLREELESALTHIEEGRLAPEVKKKLTTGENSAEEIKKAIVKSATYIKSVEERLSATLKNEYVAVSDIGTYTEKAIAEYEVDGKGITQYFTLTEQIGEELSNITGYIKTGVLDTGETGLEIGDFTGHSPFSVRLVKNRLSFFANGSEVAYISDSTLYITKAEVTGTLILGSYHVDLTDGIAFKYV